MDEFVDWIRNREYYRDQIQFQRKISARWPETRQCEMAPDITAQLTDRGIDELYAHQADAIEAIRDGQNVVLATPTASGKSLTYTIPALECARDSGGRTLYIGPQVALINDQEATLSEYAEPFEDVSVTQYTGALSTTERQHARDDDPSVVLTTPDMLHCGLLTHADDLWRAFFESLELVVIDEVHEYRGVFGSHVGLVLHRLARLCERFGTELQFVCCSATIGNPRDHAATITGLRDDRREAIETALHSGDCPGVWSTSALELGVDIGSLDAVLLDGYPGTQMATFQRAGRAGRGTEPSLVALVASEDQLDQYVIKHPQELFGGTPERAVADPENPHLLRVHTHAAAEERPITTADETYFGPTFPEVVSTLTDEGKRTRRQTADGLEWRRTATGRRVNPYERGLRAITKLVSSTRSR